MIECDRFDVIYHMLRMFVRYLRINDCIKSIDYKAKDTVDNLISSFAEEKRGRKNINSRYN